MRSPRKIPKEIGGSATCTRKELIIRWSLTEGDQNIRFFLRMERDGHLTAYKSLGAKTGKVAYRLDEVLQWEQETLKIMRGTMVLGISNKIRVLAKPSVSEWLGLWYAMWHLLSRLAPMEQRACLEHVVKSIQSCKL